MPLVVAVLLISISLASLIIVMHRPAVPEPRTFALVPRTVTVVPAEPSSVANMVSCSGDVLAPISIGVYPPEDGFLVSALPALGETVTAGQILAEIDVPGLADDVVRVTVQLSVAHQTTEGARFAFETAHQTHERQPLTSAADALSTTPDAHLVDPIEHEAEARWRSAVATEAAVSQRRDRLQDRRQASHLIAPISGIVDATTSAMSHLIRARGPVDHPVPASISISPPHAARLTFLVAMPPGTTPQPGTPIVYQIPGHGKPCATMISRVHPHPGMPSSFDVECDLMTPAPGLTPGMHGTINIETVRHSDVLTLPPRAVSMAGPAASVWIVDDDRRVAERPVLLGLQMPDRVEIIAGLTRGELVLVNRPYDVEIGQRVEPVAHQGGPTYTISDLPSPGIASP